MSRIPWIWNTFDLAPLQDYVKTEFPYAEALYREAFETAYMTSSTDRKAFSVAFNSAMNAAKEYGALQCLTRLLHMDISETLDEFAVDDAIE